MNISKRILDAINEVDLEKSSEKYLGKEWTEALSYIFQLEPPVQFQIPLCVFDVRVDKLGSPMLQGEFDQYGQRRNVDEDGNIDPGWQPGPVRYFRHEVFAILAWIAAKREDPDLTLEKMKEVLSDDFIREILTDVFLFWNMDLAALSAQVEEQLKSGEIPIEREAESLDFHATVSSDKPDE